jgi:ribosomal protein L11 methylase PrmA
VVEVRGGTLEGVVGETFAIVVANISGLTLERLAPAISGALQPGGRLIASGFLEDATEGLTRAFAAAGLAGERTLEEGVWRAIVAVRTA